MDGTVAVKFTKPRKMVHSRHLLVNFTAGTYITNATVNPEPGLTPAFYHTALNDINISIVAKSKVNATFKLATSGWGIGAREDRSLFDRIFDGNIAALSSLDRNVGWQPVDEVRADVC